MHTSGVISISLISSIYFRVLSSVGTWHAESGISDFLISEYSENSEYSDFPGASNRFRFNPLRCLESAPARGCRDAACSVRFVCRSRTLPAASLPCFCFCLLAVFTFPFSDFRFPISVFRFPFSVSLTSPPPIPAYRPAPAPWGKFPLMHVCCH